MKLAVVGCTGLVGNVVLELLDEFSIKISELTLVASPKSIGKKIFFRNQEITIVSLEEAFNKELDIAIFSAGGSVSKKWAEKFAKNGTRVIDNSSYWRMHNNIPLIVPEINGNILSKSSRIIANPNCSTIQLVLALKNIHEKFKIKRLVISTYQSVTGTGLSAVKQMQNERLGKFDYKEYPHQIDQNCFPHGGEFLPNGYTTEEMKLVNETRKIFNDQTINISATVVRIPVIGGHSEAVNVQTHLPFQIHEITTEIGQTKGVVVEDDPMKNIYPMPINAHNKNDIFVGRIRKDETIKNGFNLWIVADNLRKGAATNAVQIASHIIEHNLV